MTSKFANNCNSNLSKDAAEAGMATERLGRGRGGGEVRGVGGGLGEEGGQKQEFMGAWKPRPIGVTNAITSQFMAAIVLFGDTVWKKERYI